MALDREPGRLYHRQFSLQHALALYHADQIHRTKPKSYLMLKALVTDVLKDQQQNSLIAPKREGQVKDRAVPAATVKDEGDRQVRNCKECSPKGSCSRGASCAFRHDNQDKEASADATSVAVLRLQPDRQKHVKKRGSASVRRHSSKRTMQIRYELSLRSPQQR